jgi:hypothetical protein
MIERLLGWRYDFSGIAVDGSCTIMIAFGVPAD